MLNFKCWLQAVYLPLMNGGYLKDYDLCDLILYIIIFQPAFKLMSEPIPHNKPFPIHYKLK